MHNSLLTHRWEHNGDVITFYWLGDVDVVADRVYAIAFTDDGKILLVSDADWSPAGWLPGGGVEAGESPEVALKRELIEEANAEVVHWQKIGVQCSEDASGERSYQSFYWCRVVVGEVYAPTHEVTERYLVSPDDFLDRLFWGHSDPKAPLLLQWAVDIDDACMMP